MDNNTSYRVMKTHDDFERSVWYRASCMCGSKDCDLTLELEIDKELRMINMNFYKDLYYCSYWGDRKDRSTLKLLYGRIFKKEPPDLWLRIKGAVGLKRVGNTPYKMITTC